MELDPELEGRPVVAMIRYECGVCDMVATIVDNGPGRLAWHDHMANHADPSLFRSWTWGVIPLFG